MFFRKIKSEQLMHECQLEKKNEGKIQVSKLRSKSKSNKLT